MSSRAIAQLSCFESLRHAQLNQHAQQFLTGVISRWKKIIQGHKSYICIPRDAFVFTSKACIPLCSGLFSGQCWVPVVTLFNFLHTSHSTVRIDARPQRTSFCQLVPRSGFFPQKKHPASSWRNKCGRLTILRVSKTGWKEKKADLRLQQL